MADSPQARPGLTRPDLTRPDLIRVDLIRAVALARSGDWDAAHRIVQRHESDPLACWLHACLHRIEGDAENARYWYARSPHRYGEFAEADAAAELDAIARLLG